VPGIFASVGIALAAFLLARVATAFGDPRASRGP
jgi:hypothetical protein